MRPDDSRWEARPISSGTRGVNSATEVGHFVQFYETERFLVDSVAGFFAAGLTAGEIALGIGTPTHGKAIAQELESRGINLNVAEQRKRYTWLDATETMSMFIAEKRLDDRSFGEVIGTIISSLASQNRPIRIFGEMVSLLWADGNQEAAVRLEELWNELAKAHTFTLLCAYPMNGFTGVVNVQPFTQICACHSRVFPAESYLGLRDLDQELRTVTQMQQKVASLDAEVRRRAKLEAELRASEQRFRSLMEILPAGVYTCEAPSGKIQFYNRRAAELWGREPVPNSEEDLFCGSHRIRQPDNTLIPKAVCPMATVLAGGQPVRDREVIFEQPDGSHIITFVNIDPILDASGSLIGAVNVFQDITARKEAEKALHEAKVLAERASQAKDQFLGMLSHELRTPLTPVLMTVALLKDDPDLECGIRDQLNMMYRNVVLEARLIDDLLDLSRIVNGKLALYREQVEAHGIIQNALQMVRAHAAAKRLTIRLQLDAAANRVNADSARLQQVFWNLLQNAVKFTPDNGQITICSRNDPRGELVVEVQDSGIGIEPGKLSSIFNAFDQGDPDARRQSGGLGLGLAISKAIVVSHGGTIAAHSAGKGQGSKFVIELHTISQSDSYPV